MRSSPVQVLQEVGLGSVWEDEHLPQERQEVGPQEPVVVIPWLRTRTCGRDEPCGTPESDIKLNVAEACWGLSGVS